MGDTMMPLCVPTMLLWWVHGDAVDLPWYVHGETVDIFGWCLLGASIALPWGVCGLSMGRPMWWCFNAALVTRKTITVM